MAIIGLPVGAFFIVKPSGGATGELDALSNYGEVMTAGNGANSYFSCFGGTAWITVGTQPTYALYSGFFKKMAFWIYSNTLSVGGTFEFFKETTDSIIGGNPVRDTEVMITVDNGVTGALVGDDTLIPFTEGEYLTIAGTRTGTGDFHGAMGNHVGWT